jgi:DNA polymerase III epsilon subunit-like protein
MKLVSLDIETTSLNHKNGNILEIGLIKYDSEWLTNEPQSSTKTRLQDQLIGKSLVPSINLLLDNCTKKLCIRILWNDDELVFDSEGYKFTKNLIKDLLVYSHDELQSRNTDELVYLYPDQVVPKIREFLGPDSGTWSVAGKNYSEFDKRFLEYLPGFTNTKLFRHRVFDPSILYYDTSDNVLPNLNTCKIRANDLTNNQLFNNTSVSHTAIEDALDVLKLLMLKLEFYVKDKQC